MEKVEEGEGGPLLQPHRCTVTYPLGSQQAQGWVSFHTRNSPTQPATWPRWQSCQCVLRCP
jgi:hypothetical protein